MARILNIETSTTVCSVAIGINGKQKGLREVNDGYSHAEQLENLIDQALEESGISISELDAISISKGPGSYTGLRIGVSLAKGLCYGLNIPLISVPTLKAMACHTSVVDFRGLRIPMLDARRMEVYACVFNVEHQLVQETKAIVLDESTFKDLMENQQVVIFGPGMEKSKTIFSKYDSAFFRENVLPSAEFMIQISEDKYAKKDFEDTAYFEPYYLKDFVAGKPKKML